MVYLIPSQAAACDKGIGLEDLFYNTRIAFKDSMQLFNATHQLGTEHFVAQHCLTKYKTSVAAKTFGKSMHTIKFIRTEDAKVNFEYKDNKRGEETEESESSNC